MIEECVKNYNLTQENEERILIGVPVFNAQVYVLDALESIRAQSFTNYKVIIADNNSTDDTFAIVEKFCLSDDRFVCVKHDENIGVNANFRFVVEYADGFDYFIWKAVDDKWSQNYLLYNLELLDQEPSIVVSQGSVMAIDLSDGSRLYQMSYPLINKIPSLIFQSYLFFRPRYNFFIYGLFRMEVLKMVINDFHAIPSADRYLFQYFFLMGWKVKWVKGCEYIRGVHVIPAVVRYKNDPLMEQVKLSKKVCFDFKHKKLLFSSFNKFCSRSYFFISYVKILWWLSKFNVGLRCCLKKVISYLNLK